MCNNVYMGKKKRPKTMTELLKKSILDSGMSFKALERETGVLRQTLMKFVADEQTIRLDTADRLAAYFDLKISKK